MKKSILPFLLIIPVFTIALPIGLGVGWFYSSQSAKRTIAAKSAKADSLQIIIDLQMQELAACRKKLDLKETGMRFNSITKQYERLEWVERSMFELGLDKTKGSVLIYPYQ